MKFYSWEERCNFLIELQEDVIREFGREHYNVFIFGSFLREDYNPESSDIDLAIYTKDMNLSLQLEYYLQNYLKARDIPLSLIHIDENDDYAFVCLDPLWKNVGITEFFPESLQAYRHELTTHRIRLLEGKSMIPEVYSPSGELVFRA